MNDNDNDTYAFGRQELEPERDQRDEFRLVGRAGVTLELESAGPGETQSARVVAAESSDVSSGGLRVITGEPLTPGALLPAAIRLQPAGAVCSLTVEVIWCRALGDECWQSGLKILETGDDDYLAWMDAVARVMDGS